MNTRQVGDIAEAITVIGLLRDGYTVLKPIGEGQRFDLVAYKDGAFQRIQCKTGRLRNGAVRFPTSSSGGGRKLAPRKAYRGEADTFAVFCPDNGKLYLVPVNEVGISVAHLRVNNSRNQQTARTRLAQKFEIPIIPG